MFISLTLRTPDRDARDLGHLLRKHPDRVHESQLNFGTARVFYPQASSDECTAALWVDVEPEKLAARRTGRSDSFGLTGYINDRPWAASSLLSVALRTVYSTAMAGTLNSDPELPATSFDLEAQIAAVPAPVAEVRALFEPLGWTVTASDDGAAPTITLRGNATARSLLNQLYVLLPVLDGGKHYWVDESEIDKLIDRAGDWLSDHPARETIMRGYLAGQGSYIRTARDRLIPTQVDEDRAEEANDTGARGRLRDQRREAVLHEVNRLRPRVVVDIGCGEGALLEALLENPRIARVIGTDVSTAELRRAEKRLGLDRMPERQAARLELLRSSALYVDERIADADVAILMEVIEHVEPDRLAELERSVFGAAAPSHVVVTTPNREHNACYPHLGANQLRHPDHRFEFDRADFGQWVDDVCESFNYVADISGIGPDDERHGPPTQLAVFSKRFDDGESGRSPEGGAVR